MVSKTLLLLMKETFTTNYHQLALLSKTIHEFFGICLPFSAPTKSNRPIANTLLLKAVGFPNGCMAHICNFSFLFVIAGRM